MRTKVSTVKADTPPQTAAALMLDHKFGCLPVVDGDGRLVGIITEADFLKLAATLIGMAWEELPGHRVGEGLRGEILVRSW